MARCGNVTFWADVTVAMELVVAHLVAMETGHLVLYVRVWEGFIILGQG